MAKFCGKIGFIETVETAPGVWTESVTERSYKGDILNFSRNRQPNENFHDNISITEKVSIVSDSYANDNFINMKYICLRGHKWEISNVSFESSPRLILTVGGLYNG